MTARGKRNHQTGAYLRVGVSGEVDTLADLLAVQLLGRLLDLHPGGIVAEGRRVSHGARASASIARRTAVTTGVRGSVLRSGDMRACTMRGAAVGRATLRRVAGVRARRALRAVSRTGVGRAIKRRNSQVARHDDLVRCICLPEVLVIESRVTQLRKSEARKDLLQADGK